MMSGSKKMLSKYEDLLLSRFRVWMRTFCNNIRFTLLKWRFLFCEPQHKFYVLQIFLFRLYLQNRLYCHLNYSDDHLFCKSFYPYKHGRVSVSLCCCIVLVNFKLLHTFQCLLTSSVVYLLLCGAKCIDGDGLVWLKQEYESNHYTTLGNPISTITSFVNLPPTNTYD